VIVDNGRSRILGTKYQPVLQCIRCGSCADFCPVYRTMGGHAYDSVYTGPIGAVLAPLLDGLEGRGHLPFASTLCGACDDACPARVPLSDLLLELRADVAAGAAGPSPDASAAPSTVPASGAESTMWAFGFKGFAAVATRRRLWDAALCVASGLRPILGSARGRDAGRHAASRLETAASGRSRLLRGPGVVRAWTDARDLPLPAPASFARLWRRRPRAGSPTSSGPGQKGR